MRIVAILVCIGFLAAGCASPPSSIIGVDGFTVQAAEVPQAEKVDVFIATTRAPSDDYRELFSGDRSSGVSYARVTVSIPPTHEIGKIERPKSLPPDPRKDFVILDPGRYADAEAFTAGVDEALETKDADNQNILVYIHGYNNNMTSAILRTAQFVHDSGFKGVPVVFSWASRGRAIDYVYDLNSALHARDGILDMGDALSQTSARGFDILAHSMGNLVTVESLRQAAMTDRNSGAESRMRNIILAAPDIDIDLFREQIRRIPVRDAPIFVLVSSDDRALAISRRVAGDVDRVGNSDPDVLAELGVTVIDLSQVESEGSAHHAKFADSPEVVQLIGAGLQNEIETGGVGFGGSREPGLLGAGVLGAGVLGGGHAGDGLRALGTDIITLGGPDGGV